MCCEAIQAQLSTEEERNIKPISHLQPKLGQIHWFQHKFTLVLQPAIAVRCHIPFNLEHYRNTMIQKLASTNRYATGENNQESRAMSRLLQLGRAANLYRQ